MILILQIIIKEQYQIGQYADILGIPQTQFWGSTEYDSNDAYVMYGHAFNWPSVWDVDSQIKEEEHLNCYPIKYF